MGMQPNTSSALQLPGIATNSKDRDPGNGWEPWAGSFQIIQHETDLKQRKRERLFNPNSTPRMDVHTPSVSQCPIPQGSVSPVTSGRRQ